MGIKLSESLLPQIHRVRMPQLFIAGNGFRERSFIKVHLGRNPVDKVPSFFRIRQKDRAPVGMGRDLNGWDYLSKPPKITDCHIGDPFGTRVLTLIAGVAKGISVEEGIDVPVFIARTVEGSLVYNLPGNHDAKTNDLSLTEKDRFDRNCPDLSYYMFPKEGDRRNAMANQINQEQIIRLILI